jgi:hypothetical protein
VDSPARGLVTVGIDGGTDTIRVVGFAILLSGPLTGAHLHVGPAGANGAVVVDVTPHVFQLLPSVAVFDATLDAAAITGPLAAGTDPLGDLLAELVTEGVYVNLHTAAFPDGELRAQVR